MDFILGLIVYGIACYGIAILAIRQGKANGVRPSNKYYNGAERLSQESETRAHHREMERIAQERLSIERTDFIVSGYGQKRNTRD